MQHFIKITIEAKRSEGTTLFKKSFLIEYARGMTKKFKALFPELYALALRACKKDILEEMELWNAVNKTEKKNDSGSS